MRRRWDPDTVFEINNPSTGYPTCVGHAKTCGRRCRRVMAGSRVSSANCIAHDLAELSASAAAKDDQLYDIADSMLCWQHVHKAEEVVSKWKRQLHCCGTKSKAEDSKMPRSKSDKVPIEDDMQNLYEEIKKLQEELRKMKAERRTRSRMGSPFNKSSTEHSSRRSSWSRGDASTDTGESDTEESDIEESETEESDAEESETSETYETKEDLRKKQKREAEERAERAKEEARRNIRAKKIAEDQKWSNAWSLYNEAWQDIELRRAKGSSGAPWPTLSGKAKDVTEASVQEFFQRAPRTTEDRFLLFSQEAKRWHTDKLLSRFGNEFVNGAEKENIDLVTRVIVQRWKEAKRNKAK